VVGCGRCLAASDSMAVPRGGDRFWEPADLCISTSATTFLAHSRY
jgi:hypothetical protein